MTTWDREVDVVVLGSGCAGLTAGLAAASLGVRVEICEQASTVGGMTAISAGVAWVPAHERHPDLPVEDALAYLRAQSLESMDDELVESFVRSAPKAIDFVEANTALRFKVVPGVTDFRPDLPGGKLGGRALVPDHYDAPALGVWSTRITSLPSVDGIGFDVRTGARATGHGGRTLVAGLLEGLLEAGGDVRTDARAVELVTDDAVVGVRLAEAGRAVSVRARRGVIIATGGFEWDSDLVRSYLRGPMHVAAWPPFNRGDGLRMAIAAGAELGNMSEAWWMPAIDIDDDCEPNGRPRGWGFGQERSRPRSIMVNRAGRRFVNEACDWNAIAGAFHELHPRDGFVNDPAWLVFDAGHLDRYGAFGLRPGDDLPEWFSESPDLETLARCVGIDPDGLVATVTSWNRNVVLGADPDFDRGTSDFEQWFGDRTAMTAADRTLGPLDTPPYYAVPVAIGAVGTKGGPRTDRDGRVRHVLGGTIAGLFAAGNAMAVVLGRAYGGFGGTLGPALVSGYRAGHAAAGGSLPD